jgi:hypothetical protein
MGSRSETKVEGQLPPAAHGRLVPGMLLLGGGEMAAKLFCCFAFTRLGRVLGATRYGSPEFVLAIIVFEKLQADCGLGSDGAREIARRAGRCRERCGAVIQAWSSMDQFRPEEIVNSQTNQPFAGWTRRGSTEARCA